MLSEDLEARPDTPDGPRSVLAILIAFLVLALPAWTYLAHVRAVSELRSQAPDLDAVGSTTMISRWNPLPDAEDTLVVVRVETGAGDGGAGGVADDGASGEALAAAVGDALEAQGFEPLDRPLVLRRPVEGGTASPGGDDGGGRTYVEATLRIVDPSMVDVHLTEHPWTIRHAFPALLYGTSAVVALTVVIARSGTSARRLLGGLTLALTLIQAVALIRALWLAGGRIDAFVAETGPLSPSRLETSGADPGLQQLRAEVAALAASLRWGATTVVLLLPLWILGSLAAFSPRRRAALVALSAGSVVVLLVAVGLAPEGRAIGQVLTVPARS